MTEFCVGVTIVLAFFSDSQSGLEAGALTEFCMGITIVLAFFSDSE